MDDRGGVVSVVCMFLSIYICTRYIVEGWEPESGTVMGWVGAVNDFRDSIPGDVLLLAVCAVVGCLRVWERRKGAEGDGEVLGLEGGEGVYRKRSMSGGSVGGGGESPL